MKNNILMPKTLAILMAAISLLLQVTITAKAETVGSSNPSLIYRVLHPDTSLENQIVPFHFGDETYNVPRNYLIGGSDVPRPNEPGFFTFQVLLPDLAPRTSENQDKFVHVAPGLGNVMRVTAHYNMHLSPINDVLGLMTLKRNDPTNYSMTQTGLKKYKTFSEDIYIKQNNKLEDIFFISCMGDIEKSPGKSCTAYEQYNENIALYYSFDRKFAEDSYQIDQKLRTLISSFKN